MNKVCNNRGFDYSGSNFKTLPYSYPRGMVHVLRFDSQIDEPEYYSYFCDTLALATEDDVVEIYFSTPGGSGETMITIMNLMRMCKAHIHGVLTSSASSAGSYMFLCCHSHTVGDHVTMLCHQVSYGVCGSHHEVKSYVNHIEEEEKGLVADVYRGFLTEDEQKYLMSGGQIYLRKDEIISKLNARNNLFEMEAEKAQEDEDAAFEAMFEAPPENILKKVTKGDLIKYIRGEVDIDFETGNIMGVEDEQE